MADLSQTPASVVVGTPALTQTGMSGAAVVAGQPVYFNSDGLWYPAGAGGSLTLSGNLRCGIALDSAPGVGQPFTIFVSGQINLGATLTAGQTYVFSVNAGKIAPFSDLVTGNYVTILGVAISTSLLATPPSGAFASGQTHP